ncbi:MAG: hypothetical protein FJ160_07630 [Gammaproteobacteria bacterium]|nr:hypothetical protein [Gammaproteobacteria bacterium]
MARATRGIGEAKVRAIIEHRQRNGAFKFVDKLALLKGIEAEVLAANRALDRRHGGSRQGNSSRVGHRAHAVSTA